MRIILELVSISMFSRERRRNIRCGGQSMWEDHSGTRLLLCTYLVILSCCGQSMGSLWDSTFTLLSRSFFFLALRCSEFGSNIKLWWSIYADHFETRLLLSRNINM